MYKAIKNSHFDINDVSITNDDKELLIIYGGNFDLYWIVMGKSISNDPLLPQIDFEITKENYQIYQQFELLFENFENLNIFDEPFDEEEKTHYKKYTRYNDLYKKDKIIWYSDETNEKVANYLEINKEKDKFLISFHTQPHIEGYDEDTHHFNNIAIRFRTSGSRYEPFYILFMKMYDVLQEIDDTYDEGHQIHIEEYLYAKEKALTKKYNC